MKPIKANTEFGEIWCYQNDHIGKKLLMGQYYEKEALLVMLSNTLRRKVAIDVGACFGTHSLFFGRHFEMVYSFEPQKHLFDLVKKTMHENKINARVFNNAVGHSNMPISVDNSVLKEDVNYGGRSIGVGKQSTVQMVKLDSVFDGLKHLDLLKIDVEGAETLVFYGAQELIKKHRPVIFFEHNCREKFLEKNQIWLKELVWFDILAFLLIECKYSKIGAIGKNFLAIP